MTEDTSKMHSEAMEALSCVSGELIRIVRAMHTLGLMPETVETIKDCIELTRDAREKSNRAFSVELFGRCRDSQNAAHDLVKAVALTTMTDLGMSETARELACAESDKDKS